MKCTNLKCALPEFWQRHVPVTKCPSRRKVLSSLQKVLSCSLSVNSTHNTQHQPLFPSQIRHSSSRTSCKCYTTWIPLCKAVFTYGSSILLCISVFVLLYRLYKYTIACLLIFLFMNSWAVSSVWLWWISCYGHLFCLFVDICFLFSWLNSQDYSYWIIKYKMAQLLWKTIIVISCKTQFFAKWGAIFTPYQKICENSRCSVSSIIFDITICKETLAILLGK